MSKDQITKGEGMPTMEEYLNEVLGDIMIGTLKVDRPGAEIGKGHKADIKSYPHKEGMRSGSVKGQKTAVYAVGKHHKTNDKNLAASLKGYGWIARKGTCEGHLLDGGIRAGQEGNVEEGENFIDNAAAIAKRTSGKLGKGEKDKAISQKRHERAKYKAQQIAADDAYVAEVNRTWGQEDIREVTSLDDLDILNEYNEAQERTLKEETKLQEINDALYHQDLVVADAAQKERELRAEIVSRTTGRNGK